MAARAAVLGASGYTGAELLRLLHLHPGFQVTALSADRKAGQKMGDVFPHLSTLDLPVLQKLDEIDFDAVDFVFCALPHATTQDVIANLPQRIKIVDLSADFRLRDPADYVRWYGGEHRAPALQAEAVYGLPEIYRAEIAGARLVANTGCYVATALLPLIPVVKAGLVNTDTIVIDAKSGVTGAGRAPKEGTLFSEVSEGFHAYGIAQHRHTAELDQELSVAASKPVAPTFTPHLLPQNRGILATIYVDGEADAIHAALSQNYAAEPFVHVLPLGEAPATRHVRGSNQCRIGVVANRAPGKSIIVSTLDNLMKGASGQAIQNANIMMGYDETTGIAMAPMFP